MEENRSQLSSAQLSSVKRREEALSVAGCRRALSEPDQSLHTALRRYIDRGGTMDSSARTRNSELCCRQFLHADFDTINGAAAAAAATVADSWDSAMSNSPEDFGIGAVSDWWSSGGGGGSCFSCSLGGADLGGFGGRYAELSVVTDEGFLEGAASHQLPTSRFDCCDGGASENAYEEDDLESSASSDGSEILQMVDQLLLAFNQEVQAASAAAASESADVFELVNASGLATGFCVPTDAEEDAGDAGEDAVSALQTGEDETHCCHLDPEDDQDEQSVPNFFDEGGSQDGQDADNEASSCTTSASASSTEPSQPQPAFLATGLFRLSQEAVLEAMDYWGPLDRIRWLLWRPEPCPSRPEKQQPVAQQPPLDKSKRACSFLLKGRCRKEDCEFAHDLGKVTCKFWAAGQCFKGTGCPFLHGFAD